MISVFILNIAEAISELGNPNSREQGFHGMGASKRGQFQLLLKYISSCSCGSQAQPSMSILSWETLAPCKIVKHVKSVKNLILTSFFLSNYNSHGLNCIADLESAMNYHSTQSWKIQSKGIFLLLPL